MGRSNGRFALLLVFPAVVALAVILIAASGAGAASRRPSPASVQAARTSSSACGVNEGFDDATNLPGWATTNRSEPLGVTDWFQGNADQVFPSHSGDPTSYVAANFNNTDGTGTISNWLLTPVVTIQNGSEITFWTRTATGSTNPDRLQIRASTAGDSINAGTSSAGVGDFTHLLLDINATYQQGGYPEDWTSFTATVSDVATAMTGRFAFRYFVENGGLGGANSDYIGIDDACVSAGAPPPPPPPPPPPAVRCHVPRVLGLGLGRAKTKIRNAHCSVGKISRIHSRRVGRVVNQSPRPGTIKRRNFPVKLAVGRS